MKKRPLFLAALIFIILTVALGISLKGGMTPAQTQPAFEKSFTLRLVNPLQVLLADHAVVIPVADIVNTVPDFNPLNCEVGSGPSAIPFQADDLDGDGKPDELAFIVTLPPGPTLLTCRYSKTGTRPNPFPVKTYARLAWETQNANIGWESNCAAYRFYWGQLEAFGKLDKTLIMAEFNATYGYHEMQKWGMDILHVGDASGLGGISLWEGENRISTVNPAGKGDNQYERKVIAAGPVRAVARVDISHIGPAKARYEVTLIMSAFTDNTYSRQDIIIKSSAGGQVVYSPGIEKLKNETWSTDKGKGYITTWGEGAPNAGEVGLAAIFSPAEHVGFAENNLDRYVKLAVPSGEKRTHWLLGGWHLGLTAPKPPQAANWAVEVAQTAARVLAPVKVEVKAR
jgi:hypothetical protein